MRTIKILLVATGMSLVAACGGQGDDAAGERVANDADQTADAIEAAAESANAGGEHDRADRLEAKADAVREAGKQAEEAIDQADMKTDNPAAAALSVEAHSGLPTSDKTIAEAARGNE